MDKQPHFQIIEREIQNAIDSLVPHGAGAVTSQRLQHQFNKVVQRAFQQGESYALLSLMTVEDVAERIGVSKRRIRAIARNRQERGFPVGWQVPGTNQWLFRPEDLEYLAPDEKYRQK
jgi:hypothetical protein